MLKKLFRSVTLLVVPFLASLFIRFIHITNKKEFYTPAKVADEPVIYACWHGELLMLPYIYSHYRKIPHAKVLISPHFDGLLISKTIKYLGLETIAGSSNKNAARVLIQAMKSIKEGYDIGITPDGPKGPRHEIADGIIIMSQKTKAKIMLVRMTPTKFWQFNSWDKFVVPKPFGIIRFYATELLDVSQMGLEEARVFLKQRLDNYAK